MHRDEANGIIGYYKACKEEHGNPDALTQEDWNEKCRKHLEEACCYSQDRQQEGNEIIRYFDEHFSKEKES